MPTTQMTYTPAQLKTRVGPLELNNPEMRREVVTPTYQQRRNAEEREFIRRAKAVLAERGETL